MGTESRLRSNLAIPPGEYLEEVIAELGITKMELAKRMDRPSSKLSAIFKGEKAITPGTALQLEKVLGIPAHIWSGLESEYRLILARQQEEHEREQIKKETGLVRKFCYAELVKLNLLPPRTKRVDKVSELQKFFGVTSLFSIREIGPYQAAFRKGLSKRGASPEALAAWLRLGELKAREIQTGSFSKERLEASLGQIRGMSRLSPGQFEPDLRQRLAQLGVVLVLAPHFPRTYVHGATYWRQKDRPVLMITIRGKWADIFWFSLFHELGHILLHDKQSVFLEGCDAPSEMEQREEEADEFAKESLIPTALYKDFLAQGNYHAENIVRFAEQAGVHPGIVVGRLQHERYIPRSWHNRLRKRYAWAN